MSAQTREKIIFEGEEMDSTPITLPIEQGLVEDIEQSALERSKHSNSKIFSTACSRHYIGSWEIKDNRLYLLDIKGKYKIIGKTPIFAEYFSGTIIVTSGTRLRNIHLGFLTKYEIERTVEIENGVVKNIKTIDNTEQAIREGWKGSYYTIA